ncbi:MAG TPA: metallophosphoesterase [Bacteroidales bacterium]|nr:metallophosphoesterase [Bacteroidales bacterium]
MGLLIILIITEVLTPAVLRQHFYSVSRIKYFIAIVIHVILSLWLWILYLELVTYNGFFDTPQHIWLKMSMTGMLCAVVGPRVILSILHFSGKLVKIKNGGHKRWLTNTGMIFMVFMLTIISIGTLYGRFNFKTEAVTIKVKGLNKDLDGLKIVQLSDMHLAGFYHHSNVLLKIMEKVNSYKPDLILNTGDFVSYGWREFGRNDTIISIAKSRYGNFAVMGNHDFGTYHPFFTEADRDNNVLNMHNLIKSSGYKLLNDEYAKVNIGDAKIALIGIITRGRHPDIYHGNLHKAISGLDSVDLKIFLSHDPNQWEKEVTGKTDIDITLSGHTHGMQMGIITKKFKWSPSKYFYPHWNGLFTEGDQFQYVNRGLGVFAIPFRIWMPPEITIITLRPQ